MPRFETANDRANEASARAKVERAFGVRIEKRGENDLDWFIYAKGKLLASAEYKRRKNPSTQYPTVYLSKAKYDALMLDHETQGVFPLFFWEFDDCIRWIDVRDVDVSVVKELGRTDRPDAVNDIELMFEVPIASLLSLTQRKISDPYDEPKLKAMLRKTHGVVVYQEQVMQICREIGGMSWEDVTAVRKAMGKSKGAAYLDQWGDKFKEGARRYMSEGQADTLWSDLCGFGSYAFNRSHAVAYGIVSYWCCWLKANYPVEFAAATLDTMGEAEQQIITLREMRKEGVDYVDVDVEKSSLRWEVGESETGKYLVGPLTNLRGIGPEKAKQVINARENKDRKTLTRLLEGRTTGVKSLSPIRDRIAELHPDLKAIGIESEPTAIETIETNGKDQEGILIIGKLTNLQIFTDPKPGIKFKIADDTGQVTCRVNRYDTARLTKVLSSGQTNNTLFAIKGTIPKDFRMLWVKRVKELGDME